MKSILNTLALFSALLIGGTAAAHGGHHPPALAGHLSFKQNTLHIHASFPNDPVVNKDSLLVLEAKVASTHKETELTDNVDVVLWMPSMGHGSAPTQVERAVDANGNILTGVFNVRNVFFIMGGEWEVRVTLTDAQGARETKSFKVTLAGAGHGPH
ncbi:MAG: FixH family protein [Deltaproteobacteria bacterium]|nr:FixH family protein [Deltaproteobacteria bacterium]